MQKLLEKFQQTSVRGWQMGREKKQIHLEAEPQKEADAKQKGLIQLPGQYCNQTCGTRLSYYVIYL